MLRYIFLKVLQTEREAEAECLDPNLKKLIFLEFFDVGKIAFDEKSKFPASLNLKDNGNP